MRIKNCFTKPLCVKNSTNQGTPCQVIKAHNVVMKRIFALANHFTKKLAEEKSLDLTADDVDFLYGLVRAAERLGEPYRNRDTTGLSEKLESMLINLAEPGKLYEYSGFWRDPDIDIEEPAPPTIKDIETAPPTEREYACPTCGDNRPPEPAAPGEWPSCPSCGTI